jgi:glycosyltransferase involved in cell wall biosynthesis
MPTIPLSVDHHSFTPIDKLIAKSALGLTSETFIVGFSCSNLNDPNKGLTLLMEALKRLRLPPKTILLLAGSGDPPLVDNSILSTIYLGRISSPRFQSLFYSACDLVVVPSIIESFCLTALESMACATPVLAFRAGGIPDFIEHLYSGLLVDDVGSVRALSSLIEWASCNNDQLLELGLNARMVVTQKYTQSHIAAAYDSLYRRILAPSSAR